MTQLEHPGPFRTTEEMQDFLKREETVDIFHPPVPKTIPGKRFLAQQAFRALETERIVVGVSPAHIGAEQYYLLSRAIRARNNQWWNRDA